MKTCTRCRKPKTKSEFSWQDSQHRWKDSRCKTCRAELKRLRHKPKNAIKQYKFKRGLSANVHNNLTEEECAYIAGIIDGEGSIWSSQPKNNTKPLTISVTMIHRPTIEWLQKACGGNSAPHRNRQEGVRQAWTWRLGAARATSLLRRVTAYMQTKQEEAFVALDLGATMWNDNVRGKVTEETLTTRKALGQQLRDLKKREWCV